MNKGKKKNLSIPLFTDCKSYPFVELPEACLDHHNHPIFNFHYM